MKKKWINVLLFIAMPVCCFSQTGGYQFYSRLDTVKTSGFYNIEISPAINAHIKTDYSDIRIVNDSGKWIPHVLYTPGYDMEGIAALKAVKFTVSQNSAANTEILIEGGNKKMASLALTLSNTAAERFCALSGSNDKSNWFVISDSILLLPAPGENSTENIITLNFPASSYSFYKIVINNKSKDPFNIRSVSEKTAPASPLKKIIDNPSPQLQQKDSGNISYIKITQQQPYQFNLFKLKTRGVKYYNRQAQLYIPSGAGHSFSKPGQLLHTFTISNTSTLQFTMPLSRAKVFYLLILNQDNLPLSVDEVTTSCSNHYISAYLEKGNNYRLILDNSDAYLPDYDLSAFTTKLTDSVPYINIGEVIAFTELKPAVVATGNNKWVLWAAIAAALVILLFFTIKMMKEVDKRKTA